MIFFFLFFASSIFTLPLVRAIYSYLAQGPDELSLQEGDIIELLSGQTAEDGWWEGNKLFFSIDLNGLLKLRTFIGYNSQGQKGIFPNNYVTYYLQ